MNWQTKLGMSRSLILDRLAIILKTLLDIRFIFDCGLIEKSTE